MLTDAFARQVVEQVVDAPEVPGAGELLPELHGLVPLYVASGTPEVELVEIVERRGWARWFRAVHGSPRSTQEILTAIDGSEGVEPAQVLMVGDATTDLDGAVAATRSSSVS